MFKAAYLETDTFVLGKPKIRDPCNFVKRRHAVDPCAHIASVLSEEAELARKDAMERFPRAEVTPLDFNAATCTDLGHKLCSMNTCISHRGRGRRWTAGVGAF